MFIKWPTDVKAIMGRILTFPTAASPSRTSFTLLLGFGALLLGSLILRWVDRELEISRVDEEGDETDDGYLQSPRSRKDASDDSPR
jgi:hypothetical protein